MALSPEQFERYSQQIASQFLAAPRLSACLAKPGAVVHTYLPIRRQNEVDTWPLIHQIWGTFPFVHTWSSITDTTTPTLQHFQLTTDTYLTETKWGIPVPSGTFERANGQPDLIIVPLLAFDRQGNRVGYGGGYYDRFLAGTSADCLKIGLSFFEPVEHIENVTETDIRLTACVMPTGILYFT